MKNFEQIARLQVKVFLTFLVSALGLGALTWWFVAMLVGGIAGLLVGLVAALFVAYFGGTALTAVIALYVFQ